MQWSDVSFQPSRKTLRQFAGLWIVFFGCLAVWQGWGNANPWLVATLALLAGTIGPIGLVWPMTLRYLYVGWMIAAFPIGWTLSKLILGTIYFGVFTPVGVLFRLLKRDALRLRPRAEVASYWLPKPQAAGVRGYFRQF